MREFYFLSFILISMTSFGRTEMSDSLKIETLAAKSKCYFIAGSGGGFTGQVIQYYFFSDGNIYRAESNTKKESFVKNLTKKETKIVFKKLKALQLEKMNFNHPGNMSYFIEQHKKENVSLVKWGDRSNEVPADISTFYKYVMDLVAKD